MRRFLFVLRAAALSFTLACSSGTGTKESVTPPPACTFTNPLGKGQDPWVVRQGNAYYFIESSGRGIYVSKSSTLAGIKSSGAARVWTAPATGWNTDNVWAPELHFIDGHWYIYYAAGQAGPEFTTQRAGVLESVTDDPQGAYVDKGMLYTGFHSGTDTTNVWAIDLTVGRINGQLYAVWSGWQQNASTDDTPQQLYIARMSNPWTISSDRVQLSAPTESWEDGPQLDLEEGPEFLEHAGQTFIIYSTRESFLPDYRLGQLRLTSATADPMNPASFVKTGPVFTGAGSVYGVGHASFTTSPDGTEDWIVYHAKTVPTAGWNDRVIRTQKFGWKADGSPDFGAPVPAGQPIDDPSGECTK